MKRLHIYVSIDDKAGWPVLEEGATTCCTPQTPQGVCCEPKPELAAGAPRCGVTT